MINARAIICDHVILLFTEFTSMFKNYLFLRQWFYHSYRFVKSVRIRSFPGPHFPAFGLNTGRSSVFLCIQSECGKIRTRKTPSTDTFHAVLHFHKNLSKDIDLIQIADNFVLRKSERRENFGQVVQKKIWILDI